VGSSHCLYFRVILKRIHAEDIFDQFVLKFDRMLYINPLNRRTGLVAEKYNLKSQFKKSSNLVQAVTLLTCIREVSIPSFGWSAGNDIETNNETTFGARQEILNNEVHAAVTG
jgi:hypothetical protein